MKFCTEEQFEKFCEKWYRLFQKDYTQVNSHIDRHYSVFYGTCVVVNTLTGRTGISRCNKTDDFRYSRGMAIAYARYRGQVIPCVVINNKKEDIK